MPEFILDYGTREAAERFAKLDGFTQGYVEGLFFTWTGNDGDPGDANLDQLSEDAWKQIIEDCADFAASNADNIYNAHSLRHDYDDHRAGVDFLFTRNRHGTGFWDRGLGDVGDELTKNAHPYGSCDLYLGDDGKLYLGS